MNMRNYNRTLYGRTHARVKQNITGEGYTANFRKRVAHIRAIRAELPPMMPQKEVAALLNLSPQAVEIIELRALHKIYVAFEEERRSHKKAMNQ